MGTQPSRHEGDLHITGTLSTATLSIPALTVNNAAVAAAAAIAYTKVVHKHNKTYAQAGSSADETKVIHVVHGATCTLLNFEVGVVTAFVGDSCTIDLKKNGTTVLSAAVTLDEGDAAYAKVAGTISTAGGVDGDVYTVVQDFTTAAGTPATGVWASLALAEDAS